LDQIYRRVGWLIPLLLIGLAALALGTVGMGWYRTRSGTPLKTAFATSALDAGLAVFVVGTLIATLSPDATPALRRLDLVPFREAYRGSGVVDVVGNIVMFLPLGFLAPLRWSALRSFVRVIVVGAAFSLMIEASQFVLDVGRASSVDDVLLNATGAGIGYAISIAASIHLGWPRRGNALERCKSQSA
jgi:VanZ family protein